jgi:hypothetical protein
LELTPKDFTFTPAENILGSADSKYDSRVSHTKCKNFPEFFYKVTKSDENLVNMFHERFVKRLKKEHDKLTRFMN